MLYYAGIGSRETPEQYLKMMKLIGKKLAKMGYTLRSGGADGADLAFEEGCDAAHGKKEIMLPWHGFNESKSKIHHYPKGAFDLAYDFHPYLKNCKESIVKLMARNTCQVLGLDLKTPSSFVICYCEKDSKGNYKGGTGQALRVAEHFNIPIYNMFLPEDKERFSQRISLPDMKVHNQESSMKEDTQAS